MVMDFCFIEKQQGYKSKYQTYTLVIYLITCIKYNSKTIIAYSSYFDIAASTASFKALPCLPRETMVPSGANKMMWGIPEIP